MVKNNSFIYFIGYNVDDVIRPLCIKLPQVVGYVKHFNDGKTIIKTMCFNVTDKKTIKKVYQNMGKKTSSLLSKEFDSDPVYGDNDLYIKTKTKQYGEKINTNFHKKGIARENAACRCLSLIMLEYVHRMNNKYNPQTFLEECKYEIKKNKMKNSINNDFDPSSSDESDNDESNESDNEESNESDDKNLMTNLLMINLMINLKIKTKF